MARHAGHLLVVPLAICFGGCGADRSVPPHSDGNARPEGGSWPDLLAPYCGGTAKVEVEGNAITPTAINGQLGNDQSWWWIGTLIFECPPTSGPTAVAIKVGVQKTGSPQLPATVDLANPPPGWMLSAVYRIGSPLTSPPPFPGSPDTASFVGSISLSPNGTAMGVCVAGWRAPGGPPARPDVRLYTPPVPLGSK